MPWPADWAQLFERDAPLVVEIGFGGGDNLAALAQENPGDNVLGIEISMPSLKRGAKKIAGRRLTNARILQADSFSALRLLFLPQSISRAIINFPDPWPKAGHHHRRLISPHFLTLLASRMQPGAPLDIATDHLEYALVIEDCLLASPHFESRTPQPYLENVQDRRRTKYEQIALSEGRSPRYFLWRRNEQAVAETFPVPEESTMPHVVVLLTQSLDQLGGRFQPFHVQDGDVNIKYLHIYRSLKDNMLVVETYVSEQPFHQRLGLSIRQRSAGDLVVSMHEIGFPRPTPGVHLAVQHLLAWLQEQDPGLTVVNSTLMQQPDRL